MNQLELLPCPACGSEAEKKGNRVYRKGYIAKVGCTKCVFKVEQATLIGSRDTAYEHAANVWNRRSPLNAAAPELLAALEDIASRLHDLPLACRTPEERLDELVDWINDDILPLCEQVIAKAKGENNNIERKNHGKPTDGELSVAKIA